jgi:hypothetical protein
MSNSTQNSISEIAGGMGADYHVFLKLIMDNDYYSFSARFVDEKTKNTLVDKVRQSTESNLAKDLQSFAKEFVKEVAYEVELCPYKGPVNLKIVETLKRQTSTKEPIFCEDKWKEHNRSSSVDNEDVQEWKLNKIGRKGSSDGNMTWDLSEHSQEIDKNDCYECVSGSVGARSSEKTVTRTSGIKGISRESKVVDDALWDSKVRTKFNRDGTYFLILKAASKKGTSTTQTKETISGACDPNVKSESKKSTKDIPLDNFRLGPFKGTPYDKDLKEKNKVVTKSTSDQESYYEFDFTLSRE